MVYDEYKESNKMCGIAGVAGTITDEEICWLKYCNLTMESRGPDGDKIWKSNKGDVAFSHRRLSIFDISEKGVNL